MKLHVLVMGALFALLFLSSCYLSPDRFKSDRTPNKQVHKYDATPGKSVNDWQVTQFVDNVETLLAYKARRKAATREFSSALQVAMAALAGGNTEKVQSKDSMSGLALVSVLIPDFQKTSGAGEEAAAYSQALQLVQYVWLPYRWSAGARYNSLPFLRSTRNPYVSNQC